MSLFSLRCGVQHYAWGSPTAIPERFGWPVTGEPHAEVWIGAHPVLPSSVLLDDEWIDLGEAIANAPLCWLGSSVIDRFGPTLPMLAKIMGIGHPLSLQAHPSTEQAREGFAREDAAGIDRLSPYRSYRDDRAKPELICALTSMDALCGFRDVVESRELLASLGGSFVDYAAALHDETDLVPLVGALLECPREQQTALVIELLAALPGLAWREEALLRSLAAAYPDDAGVVVALLLNHVMLEPGEALFLPAGNMHAYLSGMGVEVMASSDNVLRGGLTPKHIAIDELIKVLVPTAGPWPITRPIAAEGVSHWSTPADEVELWRGIVSSGEAAFPRSSGPSLFVCTDGGVQLVTGDSSLSLGPGNAAYGLPDADVLVRGDGTVWRATVRV